MTSGTSTRDPDLDLFERVDLRVTIDPLAQDVRGSARLGALYFRTMYLDLDQTPVSPQAKTWLHENNVTDSQNRLLFVAAASPRYFPETGTWQIVTALEFNTDNTDIGIWTGFGVASATRNRGPGDIGAVQQNGQHGIEVKDKNGELRFLPLEPIGNIVRSMPDEFANIPQSNARAITAEEYAAGLLDQVASGQVSPELQDAIRRGTSLVQNAKGAAEVFDAAGTLLRLGGAATAGPIVFGVAAWEELQGEYQKFYEYAIANKLYEPANAKSVVDQAFQLMGSSGADPGRAEMGIQMLDYLSRSIGDAIKNGQGGENGVYNLYGQWASVLTDPSATPQMQAFARQLVTGEGTGAHNHPILPFLERHDYQQPSVTNPAFDFVADVTQDLRAAGYTGNLTNAREIAGGVNWLRQNKPQAYQTFIQENANLANSEAPYGVDYGDPTWAAANASRATNLPLVGGLINDWRSGGLDDYRGFLQPPGEVPHADPAQAAFVPPAGGTQVDGAKVGLPAGYNLNIEAAADGWHSVRLAGPNDTSWIVGGVRVNELFDPAKWQDASRIALEALQRGQANQSSGPSGNDFSIAPGVNMPQFPGTPSGNVPETTGNVGEATGTAPAAPTSNIPPGLAYYRATSADGNPVAIADAGNNEAALVTGTGRSLVPLAGDSSWDMMARLHATARNYKAQGVENPQAFGEIRLPTPSDTRVSEVGRLQHGNGYVEVAWFDRVDDKGRETRQLGMWGPSGGVVHLPEGRTDVQNFAARSVFAIEVPAEQPAQQQVSPIGGVIQYWGRELSQDGSNPGMQSTYQAMQSMTVSPGVEEAYAARPESVRTAVFAALHRAVVGFDIPMTAAQIDRFLNIALSNGNRLAELNNLDGNAQFNQLVQNMANQARQ